MNRLTKFLWTAVTVSITALVVFGLSILVQLIWPSYGATALFGLVLILIFILIFRSRI
jgi:uncharacterized membrane protein YqjE